MKKHALKIVPRTATCLGLLLATALLIGCAAKNPLPPFDTRYQRDRDSKPVDMPEERDLSGKRDWGYNLLFRQLYRAVYLPGYVAAVAEKAELKEPKEAENANAWDEVPDSSWFTNRVARRDPGIEEIRKGPRSGSGPDLSSPWEVIKGKTMGITPGFVIRDSRGDIYFVKFDPPAYGELVTGAEIISSLLLHAAGYNVPENFVVKVPVSIFVLGKKASTKDKYLVKQPMTQEDLGVILARVDSDEEDMVRVIASKGLPGRPIGPFDYIGRRPDDPNDRIPHEHRRELRGYRMFSAWINNFDIRPPNTLDMYQGRPGEGYVKHFMLDFGSSLGSRGYGPKHNRTGYEYFLDYKNVSRNFITLGLTEPYWLDIAYSGYPSVGVFEGEAFDPLKWRPSYPIRPFELMTDSDAFWAARIIMSFTDEMIEAIVDEAGYSQREAADYLARTLIKRRDRIGRVWFGRVTPLDNFSIQGRLLLFRDLAADHGFAKGPERRYFATIRGEVAGGGTNRKRREVQGNGSLELPPLPGSSADGLFSIRLEVEDSGIPVGEGVNVTVFCGGGSCGVTGVDR